MFFIGIDISKLTFDVAYRVNTRYAHKQFANNNKGFDAFLLWIKTNEKVFVYL